MHFVIQQPILLDLVKSVLPAVKPMPGIPTPFTLIKVEKNRIDFTVVGREVSVNSFREDAIVVKEEGSLGVNPKILHDLVEQLPNSDIELKQHDGRLRIKCGRRILHLGIQPEESFLYAPSYGGEFFEIENFYHAVGKVSHCLDTDGAMSSYSGFLMTQKYIGATDGRRLAIFQIDLPFADRISVPSEWLIKFKRIFKEDKIHIAVYNNHLLIRNNFVVAYILLLEKAPPQLEKAYPTGSYDEAVISKEELLRSLKVAKTVSFESLNIVRFSFKNTELTIEAETQSGKVEDTISCEFYKEFEGFYNLDFMIAAISKLDGEKVVIQLRNALRQILIREEGFDQVLMPVKHNNAR